MLGPEQLQEAYDVLLTAVQHLDEAAQERFLAALLLLCVERLPSPDDLRELVAAVPSPLPLTVPSTA